MILKNSLVKMTSTTVKFDVPKAFADLMQLNETSYAKLSELINAQTAQIQELEKQIQSLVSQVRVNAATIGNATRTSPRTVGTVGGVAKKQPQKTVSCVILENLKANPKVYDNFINKIGADKITEYMTTNSDYLKDTTTEEEKVSLLAKYIFHKVLCDKHGRIVSEELIESARKQQGDETI